MNTWSWCPESWALRSSSFETFNIESRDPLLWDWRDNLKKKITFLFVWELPLTRLKTSYPTESKSFQWRNTLLWNHRHVNKESLNSFIIIIYHLHKIINHYQPPMAFYQQQRLRGNPWGLNVLPYLTSL